MQELCTVLWNMAVSKYTPPAACIHEQLMCIITHVMLEATHSGTVCIAKAMRNSLPSHSTENKWLTSLKAIVHRIKESTTLMTMWAIPG